MENGTSFHMCLSVRGALNNWKASKFKKVFRDKDDTRWLSAKEAKEALYDELAQGHEVIPMGECDNFDYKTGCKGHKPKAAPVQQTTAPCQH